MLEASQVESIFSSKGGIPETLTEVSPPRYVDFIEPVLRSGLLVKTARVETLEHTLSSIMEPHKITANRSLLTKTCSIKRLDLTRSQLLYVRLADTLSFSTLPLKSLYGIFPVSGCLHHVGADGKERKITSGKALIFSPGESVNVTWAENTQALILHIPEATIRRYLIDFFYIIATKRILFERVLLCEKPDIQPLCKMLSQIMCDLKDSNSLMSRGITTKSIEEQLVLTLIDTIGNNYSEELKGRLGNFKPKYVKKAIDYIVKHAHKKFTMAELADFSEVSLRTLQLGFRRLYGISPANYVRDYKLYCVREVLRQAENTEVIIGDIAAQWGFFHSSNFAKHYKTLFGEYPSDTLNQSN